MLLLLTLVSSVCTVQYICLAVCGCIYGGGWDNEQIFSSFVFLLVHLQQQRDNLLCVGTTHYSLSKSCFCLQGWLVGVKGKVLWAAEKITFTVWERIEKARQIILRHKSQLYSTAFLWLCIYSAVFWMSGCFDLILLLCSVSLCCAVHSNTYRVTNSQPHRTTSHWPISMSTKWNNYFPSKNTVVTRVQLNMLSRVSE